MTDKIDDLIISTQKRLGVTSVVVTHDMASAVKTADRIAMVHEGELIAVDTVDNFRRINEPIVRAFLRELYIDEGVQK